MKKSKDKSKDKSKSFKKLKVLAASTLGLSMLLSVPQMPNLVNLVGQIGADKNQSVVDFSVKDAIKNNSAVTGATTTTVEGANTSVIAQDTGVSGDRNGGGLADESKLPQTAVGTWEETFWTTDAKTGAYRRMNLAELKALSLAEGNFFHKTGDEAFTISTPLEFAFFSAYMNLNSYADVNGQTIKLGADINLQGKAWRPMRATSSAMNATINFDGQNFKILNAYVYDKYELNLETANETDTIDTYYKASIFGNWGSNSTIENLIVENANIQSWRDVSIIATTTSSYTLRFNNVIIRNSQVVGPAGLGGSYHTTGIATSAYEMVDCYMENCVVKATDHDAELLGSERIKQSLKQSNRYAYVYGFGRAIKVYRQHASTTGIKNCAVYYDSYQDGFNPLTGSVNRYAYVVGVVNCDIDVREAEFTNITVDDCDIYSTAYVGDANAPVEFANGSTTTLGYNNNLGAYVWGAVRYSSSSTTANVQAKNITVQNSKIYDEFNVNPANATNSKDMYFSHTTGVMGAVEIGTKNVDAGSTLYKDIIVRDCDIYADGETNVIANPTYRRTASNQYYTITRSAHVAGLSNVGTSANDKASKYENCKVIDCNISAEAEANSTDDNNYYINTSLKAFGMTSSRSAYGADYYDCVVENCNIKTDTNVDNGTFTGTQGVNVDYANPTNVSTTTVGLGYGSFYSSDETDPTKGCKVVNSKLFAKSYDTKNTAVDKVGGISGSANVIGLGITGYRAHAEVKNAVVDNCEMEAQGQNVGAYISGIAETRQNGGKGYTVEDSVCKNSNMTSTSYATTALIAGIARTRHQQTSNEPPVNVFGCTTENVKMNLDSTNGSVYAVGGLFSDNYVYGGVYYNDNTVTEVSMVTDRPNGYTHFAGGFYLSSTASLREAIGNEITNIYASNNITEASRVSHAYMAGLGLIRSARVANDVASIRDNVVDNAELINKVNGTDSVSHSLFTTGLVFSDTSAVINAYNNTVRNTTVDTSSNVGNVYASGMFIQTTDRKSVVEECYAYNNNVSAVFNRDGSNASRDVYATGLAGWYIAETRNCVVGSGTVYARNDISTAGASGVAAGRGFTSGYTQRANNTADAVWYTKITGCYNFAEVKAETGSSSSVTYAAGIGRAEIMLNCANYGNVTGNYAGGITTGYTHTSANATNTQHSIGLTVKNCMNAGTVCRANGGGQSFVGGIIARYEMRYYAQHKFVVENNISVGGVYSGYDEATNTYSQTLSTGTFMGLLYGYLSIPVPSDKNIYDTISIKNNYLLVEEDGLNKGFYYADNVIEGVEVKGRINAPTLNYIATTEGVFYNTNAIATNKDRFAQMYTNCMEGAANKYITSEYDALTFAKDNALDSFYGKEEGKWAEWTCDTNSAPELAEIEVQRLMVRYDIGNNTGKTPNVDIVEKGQAGYSYTLSDGLEDGYGTPSIIDQAGVSLEQWNDGANDYAPSADRTSLTNGVITYDAVVNYTEYTLEFETEDHTTIAGEQTITLNTSSNMLTATYDHATGGQTVTAIEFQVKKANADKWVTLQVIGVPTGTFDAEFDIGERIDANFIAEYADNYNKIYVKAVPSTVARYEFTKTDLNAEGTGHYTITATYGGVDAFTNAAPEDAEVDVLVKADNYYTLKSVTVGGETVAISNNTATYKVTATANTEIKVDVEKTQYNVDIQFQNLQGVTLDSELVSTLIANPSQTMAVEESLPAFTARKDVKGYRFVGWKLQGMDSYLADTNGTIDTGYTVAQADFARYLAQRGAETKFTIIAVYQRQYQFNVALNNEFGATFASEYELTYVDENGVNQVLTNVEEGADGATTLAETGSYMIDESTFLQLKIKPNKRVDVVAPENEQFGNNVVYVYLTGNKDVAIDFEIRPLTINTSILNVETPTAEAGLPANQLVHAVAYTIKNESGDVVGSSSAGSKLNINDRLTFDCLTDVLATGQFRFVEMRLKNVITGDYDVVALNEEGQKVVDDDFFNNYVDEVGQIDASMKVIKQYKTEIVAENLVSEDDFLLGSYTVEILDEQNAPAPASRYTVNELNKSYVLDNGLQLVIKATVENDYAEFVGFTGMFETDTTAEFEAVANISDNRSISLRFEKSVYTIEAPYNATVGGSLEFTKSFKLGDTITISYTPKDNYQITDWKLVGKALTDLGAVQTGNTISIKVTEEFLAAMESAAALNNEKLTLNSDINTMMNPTLFYGIVGGGAVILILFGTVVLLVLRSKKLKKQKEENERKLNDIARKFNVADMIKDLKK